MTASCGLIHSLPQSGVDSKANPDATAKVQTPVISGFTYESSGTMDLKYNVTMNSDQSTFTVNVTRYQYQTVKRTANIDATASTSVLKLLRGMFSGTVSFLAGSPSCTTCAYWNKLTISSGTGSVGTSVVEILSPTITQDSATKVPGAASLNDLQTYILNHLQ